MNLHEFQAKQLLRAHQIDTPRGIVAASADAATAAATELGGEAWVVKAQIHAGGRGKAGGVKLCRSLDEVRSVAETLLGKSLVTLQNAPEGQPVNQVLVEETLDIARELYLSLLVDRESESIAVVASAAGGMDIEEVAQATPEKVLKAYCGPMLGLQDFQCRELAFALDLSGEAFKDFCRLLPALYRVFRKLDLSLLEINPLVVTDQNRVLPLDCKMALEDNALYRHAELAAMRDDTQIDAKEAAANAANVNYVALHGNIGCMVNGAGLAMATMDLIQLHGGTPANFLDVGGGATPATVAQGFKIILLDPNVRAVLINIFGGIVRCDVIAEGIIQAVKEIGVNVPVVVRLEGTNAELGRKLLAESGLAILAAESLTQAAELAVAQAKQGVPA
ncbi:MAG: ADP-forming succinate--CoA ligase subunit beta [Thiobacillus sp.]